jgi:MYXO-CTERM domain-containing protein
MAVATCNSSSGGDPGAAGAGAGPSGPDTPICAVAPTDAGAALLLFALLGLRRRRRAR